ncbi:hypothetical protein BDF14DRAFT_420879 [Spinellus fusiger]|nr:hypothetical protein BDF14DRAFT_420879 [Spinellus fusiger]
MLSLLIGYCLLLCLVFIEHRYQSPRTTTVLQLSADDQGSTRLLLAVWMVSVTLVPLCVFLDVGAAPVWLGWVGVVWLLGSVVLLRWATYVNPFYLRAVATTDDQYICTDGPYKLIRHPGYAAFLLAWVGLGLTTGNGVACLFLVTVALYAYLRRIKAEEKMMLAVFGMDYQHYVEESYRLVPYLF